MKYIGKKHLNSNMYKKIRMKEKDGKVVISAIPDEKYKNMELLKTSTPDITDTIDGLNDEEKIEEITKYFLRNNTRKEIDDFINEYYDRYSGLYLKSKNFLKSIKNVYI